MNVALSTNRQGAMLEFRDIKRFGDESGFLTVLALESGDLSARIRFYFEPHSLKTFLGELRQMDQTLSGSATLRPMWESPFIRLALDHRGHIAVSGELGDADQHLRFTFDTDQTCLRPLISDLDACLHLPAV